MDVLQALHDTFAAFGNVLSCKVAIDERGRSKGYGFVHYDTAEAAESAIKAVDGMLLNDKKVYVGHHVSKKVSGSIRCCGVQVTYPALLSGTHGQN